MLDESMTVVQVAKIENRQVDKAMGGVGTVQMLKKGDNVVLTGGARARFVHDKYHILSITFFSTVPLVSLVALSAVCFQ